MLPYLDDASDCGGMVTGKPSIEYPIRMVQGRAVMQNEIDQDTTTAVITSVKW